MKFNIILQIRNYFINIDRGSYLVFLGMIYTTIFFSSFVMGYKTVELYGWIICSSVLIFPLLFPLNDSITELLGPKTSYFMVVALIICEFLFSFFTNFLSHLPSPENWKNQEMYPLLTSGFIHIAIANSTSIAIGFVANIYVYTKWGIRLFGSGFFIRSLGATAIGELLFTISTNLITFYGIAELKDIINIIVSDYIIKMFYSFVICIPNAYLVGKIRGLTKNDINSVTKNVISISQTRARYRT